MEWAVVSTSTVGSSFEMTFLVVIRCETRIRQLGRLGDLQVLNSGEGANCIRWKEQVGRWPPSNASWRQYLAEKCPFRVVPASSSS